MNLNNIIAVNYSISSRKWLSHLKVKQKIALGYAIALGISAIGTMGGILVGNYWEQEVLEYQKHARLENNVLNRLQASVLQVRTHQQQLIPLSNQPADFQEEYAHIGEHFAAINQNWAKIKLLAEHSEHQEREKLKLLNFLEFYEGVTDKYIQKLDELVQQIDISSSSSAAEIQQAQTLLLEFTNSDLALKFDGISDELTEIVELFTHEAEEAQDKLNRVVIIRNWMIFSSIFISIAIATLLGKQISQGISTPIQELTYFAQKFTEDANFIQVPVTTEDEVGTLAFSFNKLISQVKQLLESQKSNTAHLKAILNNLADGLFVIDTNGDIINFNPVMIKMFRLQEIDIQGINYRELVPELKELLNKSQQQPNAVFTTELQLSENRIGLASVTAILEANCQDDYCNCLGSVVLIRDITQEKEVDRMKTDFISTVSHELRTPLTSVLGFASIIQEKLEEDVFPLLPSEERKTKKTIRRVKDNINIIVSEAERLTALINDVLDIAKMEAGKLEWKQEKISIEEVIERSIAATSSLFDASSLELIPDIEPQLPEILGDRDRLIQVVINLISNAVKFTEVGSVTCRVRYQNHQIVVSIIDTGYGIAPEDQAQVFEKFKQVGETLTNKPKGTGLGLPICKQIIEHHGGNIWVESELGIGSTFSFSIPVTVATSLPEFNNIVNLDTLVQQLKEHSVSNNSINKAQKTILVVDDDINIRELLRQSLETQGYAVEEAKDGLDAINQIKTVKPDLIILDLMMPQINGFDAVAIIKNDPITMDIPIIMLSIFEDKERGYKLGIDRYMTKPIDSLKLIQEISFLLSQGTSTKKVLVVDKNASTLITLSEVLQAQGYSVTEASNSEECIEKALSLKPDMIIVDSVLSQQHDLVKTLRFKNSMENFCFILLGDGSNNY